MLDRFEDKHGTYDEILDKYLHWSSKVSPDAKKEANKYNRLLGKHDKLVWLVMGYHIGIKEKEKEGRIS
jgi:hypothetical protein